jgi:uncharacterized membrane protein
MIQSPSPATIEVSQRPAYLMGGFLLLMGTGHFAAPAHFDEVVPAELPGSARLYTYASGIAELATGALLLNPRTRRLAASSAAALFVAVFPANVNTVRVRWGKGRAARFTSIIRLPLQIPLIACALKIRCNA